MYESLKFAKDLKGTFTNDVNEAIKASEKFTVEPIEVQLKDIKIHEDGTLENGSERKVTKRGFENLCKILGIPRPFAREIPNELLFYNIKKLQTSKSSLEVVLLERPDGIIANIVKGPYSESSYVDVLTHFSEREDIQHIDITEALLTIALTFTEVSVKASDLQVGRSVKPDVFYVGSWIYNSILKETALHTESGLYRTHCQNSYIAPFLGRIRANYLKEPDERLLKFSENVRFYDGDILARLQRNFDRFESKYLYDVEFIKLWRAFAKAAGIAEADKILGIDEPTRKEMSTAVLLRSAINKRASLLGQPVSEPALTAVKAYDAINGITEFAKSLTGLEKYAVEKIGGVWINKLILN